MGETKQEQPVDYTIILWFQMYMKELELEAIGRYLRHRHNPDEVRQIRDILRTAKESLADIEGYGTNCPDGFDHMPDCKCQAV